MAIVKGDQVRMTQLCISQLAASEQRAFFMAFQQAGFQGIVVDVTAIGVSIHPLQQSNVQLTVETQHVAQLLEKVEKTDTKPPVTNNLNMDASATAHPFDLKNTPLPIVQAYHLLTYFSHARDRLVVQACEQYRFKSALQLQTLSAKGGNEVDMAVVTAPFEISFGGEEQQLADAAYAILNDYLSLSYEVVREKLLDDLEAAQSPLPPTPIMTTPLTQLEPIVEPFAPIETMDLSAKRVRKPRTKTV